MDCKINLLVSEFIKEIELQTDITEEDIFSNSRSGFAPVCKHLIFYFLKKDFGNKKISYADIKKVFRYEVKSHSSINYGINNIKAFIKNPNSLANKEYIELFCRLFIKFNKIFHSVLNGIIKIGKNKKRIISYIKLYDLVYSREKIDKFCINYVYLFIDYKKSILFLNSNLYLNLFGSIYKPKNNLIPI